MRMFRKDEGFTLVELMVVVLIIGILVAIAIPVFNAASGSARLRSCQSNQRTIEGACEQWLAAAPTNLRAALNGNVSGTHPLLADGYIKTQPVCPSAAVGAAYPLTSNASTTSVACPAAGASQHPHY
jgi:prepilin-type N-terminal cleavage/methylation domain-containing protein